MKNDSGAKQLTRIQNGAKTNHVEASWIKENIFPKKGLDWDEYFKFGFVRNPWDRELSNYFFNNGKLNIEIEPTGYDYEGKPKKRIVNVQIHNVERSPNMLWVGEYPSEISYDGVTKILNVGVMVGEEKVLIRVE
jgi:hypothetical protein